MIRLRIVRGMVALLTLAVIVEAPETVSAFDTYLALGDSLAFGESLQDGTTTNGDRGYVSLFANALAASNGGVRPDVVNLAVDGETTTTFFTRGTDILQLTPVPGYPSYSLNTNYAGHPSASQNDLLLDTATNLAAGGHSIDTVTLHIGANDFLQYAYDSNGNIQLPTTAQIDQAVNAVQTNLYGILTELKTLAPSAHVFVLGYYNAFEPMLGSPDAGQQYFASQAGQMILGLNSILEAEAHLFGATYVDLMPAFTGKVAGLTQFLAMPGNIHPTEQGYQLISNAITAVPEPASLTLVGLGTLGLGLMASRRTRAN